MPSSPRPPAAARCRARTSQGKGKEKERKRTTAYFRKGKEGEEVNTSGAHILNIKNTN